MHIRNLLRYWRCFGVAIVIIIILNLQSQEFQYQYSLACYSAKGNTLPDISEVPPRKGKSIFFHETSCKSLQKGKITITSRQACAVESAAIMNPNLDVYLLYTSPGIVKNEGDESDLFLSALLSYKNVKILHLNYERYINNTPVGNLWKYNKIQNSRYSLSHASDILRYVTLWKYGGIYLDLDVVILKSLEDLPANFAGLQSLTDVAAGVMGFAASGKGHEMAERCLLDLQKNFDGDSWGNNGPGVITRLLLDLCGITNRTKDTNLSELMVDKDCGGFTVFTPTAFYPISYQTWYWYFDEYKLQSMILNTKDSYAIHTWNKFSANTKVLLNSGMPYFYYAKKYCPKVVAESTRTF
ncbi:lactosylceramide 4-alpha-galactosyltransferase-like [Diorhabda carinulata]|uniref:lactosylceramide 4-alpha-galactosyltransferase-like n=1 Tax=Diorhabda carinulata TaxID=1163345 RepID=UPI0025A004B6|nr:lactosylceramide 4-alpha-galactosyltransferase-like [Diorhabda carinulata]XP_057669343.1 lactosylceramide 4-alpha-galactosyltransferase-like [Diorhabda carinulata]XP_057669344.1 lactosylceramide 4-alpha-galactosyltransferase-like [Diorhabda carinulata]